MTTDRDILAHVGNAARGGPLVATAESTGICAWSGEKSPRCLGGPCVANSLIVHGVYLHAQFPACAGAAKRAVCYMESTGQCWTEARGWLCWRKKHGSRGALGAAFLEVQSLFEPSKKLATVAIAASTAFAASKLFED